MQELRSPITARHLGALFTAALCCLLVSSCNKTESDASVVLTMPRATLTIETDLPFVETAAPTTDTDTGTADSSGTEAAAGPSADGPGSVVGQPTAEALTTATPAPTAVPPPALPTPTAVPTTAPTPVPVPTATPRPPTPTPVPPAPTATPTPTSGTNTSALEAQMVALVNQVRANAGRPALATSASMAQVARNWSATLSSSFQHNPSVGSQIPSGWNAWGENIAYNVSMTAAQSALEASSGHYANMINPSFTHVGIGIVEQGGYIYVTQVFAGY